MTTKKAANLVRQRVIKEERRIKDENKPIHRWKCRPKNAVNFSSRGKWGMVKVAEITIDCDHLCFNVNPVCQSNNSRVKEIINCETPIIYAFTADDHNKNFDVQRGEVLRIGTGKSFKNRIIDSWGKVITERLRNPRKQQKAYSLPLWEAWAWTKLLNGGRSATVWATKPMKVIRGFGEIDCRLSIEAHLLQKYRPRMNRSLR